mgnify:FL=1
MQEFADKGIMIKLVFSLLLVLLSSDLVFAKSVKPLYKLSDKKSETVQVNSQSKSYIIGTDKGLFRVSSPNNVVPIWAGGSVEQILRIELPNEEGKTVENWYFRTNKGILFSSDLQIFELRNEGLPFLTLKDYDGQNVTFEKQVHTLKDLGVNPSNPKEMVTATKDNVFFSRDGGLSWKNMGSMSRLTSGIKAVAIANMDIVLEDGTKSSELVIFMSHPIFGLSYIKPNANKPAWYDITKGFEMMPTMTSPDEIADILPVRKIADDGSAFTEVYLTQTYIPRLYRLNWSTRSGECLYKGTEPCETYDGLTVLNENLIFSKNEGIGAISMDTFESPGVPEKFDEWKKNFAAVPGIVSCAWVPKERSGFDKGLALNELWLLYPGTINSEYAEKADGRKSLYVSAYQCRLQSGIDKFKNIVKENKLNSIVIDMKDDYGLLRYETNDSLVKSKAKITQYHVDLDLLVREFKKENVYLIARIVTFKDKNLVNYGGNKYAVWNKNINSPWLGIREYEDVLDPETGEVTGRNAIYYDEAWVDPYCHEVWEYNVAIAKELVARGFDEIQFDYIRFPTDGTNLRQASYRWKDEGMDKESALVSFLRYARENINAPIGIDIYGANGWYRSGTRTGQDVEMMEPYVDVIAPMFYPSHFENSFLNYAPIEDRPYRIYFYGTYRNTIMGRNRIIVRPWVQAFYLNVAYDRQFYNESYVQKEIFGCRDAANHGYMYWNNSGNYTTIQPDIEDNAPFTGTAPEASLEFRKPAVGTNKKPEIAEILEPVEEKSSFFSKFFKMTKIDENESDKKPCLPNSEYVYTQFLQVPHINQK